MVENKNIATKLNIHKKTIEELHTDEKKNKKIM
jgi:hypothetical protein